ncbi:unnamed protein product [Leptosia nina]|uniref:Uncharacterized protein n=1 Tax=Leptosia nina TaxID=320188 RepID=A0AAV1J314_9NEOP
MIDIPSCGRCCFCLPLRRGVITFGYINIVWSALMIAVISPDDHHRPLITFYGTIQEYSRTLGIVCRAIDILMSLILVFGGHMKRPLCLKIFFYYTSSTLLAVFVMQIVEMSTTDMLFMEYIEFAMFIFSAFIHIYILLQVRSLIKKLEFATSSDGYENQMQQIGTTDLKFKSNTESLSVDIETLPE